MKGIAAQLERQYPDSQPGSGRRCRAPRRRHRRQDPADPAVLLLAGAALLLVIACVNVISLLLVRSEGRKRELAVRSALGASNGRLVRQFVTEATLLVAAGGVAGLLLARRGRCRLLFGLISEDMLAQMPFLERRRAQLRASRPAPRCSGLLATALLSIAPAAARPLQRDARGPGRRRARLVGSRLAAPRLQAGGPGAGDRDGAAGRRGAARARACIACSTSSSASIPTVSRRCRWPRRGRASKRTPRS